MKYLKYLLLPLPFFVLFASLPAFARMTFEDFYLDGSAKDAFLKLIDGSFERPQNIASGDSLYHEGVNHSDTGEMAAGLYIEAMAARFNGEVELSDSVFILLENLLSDKPDFIKVLTEALSYHSDVIFELNDVDRAADNAQHLIDLASSTGNAKCLCAGYQQLATVHQVRQELARAFELYNKAVDIALQNDLKMEALNCYYQLAFGYDFINDTAKSIECINHAIEISNELGIKKANMTLRIARLSLSSIKLENDELVKEIDELKKDPLFDQSLSAEDRHKMLAEYYAAKNQKKLAFAHVDSLKEELNILSATETVYITLGDWEMAYYTGHRITIYRDSLQHAQQSELLAEKDAQLNNAQLRFDKERLETRNKVILGLAIAIIILLVLAAIITNGIARRRRLKRQKALLENEVARQTAELREKNNQLEAQNEEIFAQKEAIFNQKEEILAQNDMLEKRNKTILDINKDMTDSIGYASRIQSAILPDMSQFVGDGNLSGAFVVFIPLKTVSGDFYWAKHVADAMVFVCADCTGHGVPGAFMSMIGSTLLTEICQGDSLLHASEILEELDHRLKLQLDQSGGTDVIKDGMDLSIVIYRPAARLAEVASARRPIYFRHADTLSELKGVKRSIGDRDEVSSRLPFETVSLPVESGDALYVCTDGFQDQFGGLKKDGGAGKRLKNAGVKEWIDDVRDLPIEEQGARLELRIRQWMDGYAQVDDITMLGLQF
ncbi:MAG: SpoIIE family protein phosphatase [Bacteroidales bacterium]|nr:SpoIIE family protein phosphatase [Bacteroidales bacterium]